MSESENPAEKTATESTSSFLADSYSVVQRMVAADGCAWHGIQTHETLVPYLIEETAEFIDAVETGASARDIASELGDVLYQVLFHAAIAERDAEGYDLRTVDAALSQKLKARHPHVFGDRGYMSVEELNAEWERLKEDAAGEERGSRGVLEGVPQGMPTLARAAKVVERLKRAHLLQTDLEHGSAQAIAPDADAGVVAVVPSAVARPGVSAETPGEALLGDELLGEELLGEELLRLVMRANAGGFDVDRALRRATGRLIDRTVPGEQAQANGDPSRQEMEE